MNTTIKRTYEIDEEINKSSVIDIRLLLDKQDMVLLQNTNPDFVDPTMTDVTILVAYPTKSHDYLKLTLGEYGWYILGVGIPTDSCKEVSIDEAIESVIKYRELLNPEPYASIPPRENGTSQDNASVPARVRLMMRLQERMNCKVNADWISAEYPWYRAVWVECAEMLDHYGWKWWKQQDCDVEQVKLELVDIFHFCLSMILSSTPDTIEDFIEDFEDYTQTHAVPLGDFCTNLEAIAGAAVVGRTFDIAAFANCMDLIGMDFDELYKLYVAKNTLNMFRQASGYKEGTYIKEWDGKEDNVVMMEILKDLPADESLQSTLYSELHLAYVVMKANMLGIVLTVDTSSADSITVITEAIDKFNQQDEGSVAAAQHTEAQEIVDLVGSQVLTNLFGTSGLSVQEFISTSNASVIEGLESRNFPPSTCDTYIDDDSVAIHVTFLDVVNRDFVHLTYKVMKANISGVVLTVDTTDVASIVDITEAIDKTM